MAVSSGSAGASRSARGVAQRRCHPTPGTQTPGETQEELEFDVTPGPSLEVTPPEDLERPDFTPIPGADQAEPPEVEPRVLVSEVVVTGATGDLETVVYNSVGTLPGRTTTRSQLQEDINAIFATGFFANVRVIPEDTPLGVRITYDVQPNPVLSQVQLADSRIETLTVDGVTVPTQAAIDDIFQLQYGDILNFRDLQIGIDSLNGLYQENGYVLAQIIDAPEVSPDGVVTLQVAEGVIENIQVQFLDDEGNTTDEEGNPIEGNTREFIITRELQTQPGDVFNQTQVQSDLQRVFGLGLFEDVRLSLNPGQDPRQVDVTVNVIERQTGSLSAGVGVSSSSGFYGTASFQQLNLGGNNQRLGAEIQIGTRDLLFDVSFTDPWIAGDPYRTSYTVNAFARESISLIFDGGEDEVELDNGDRPRVRRVGGGVSFARPLGDWLGLQGWRASLGLQYQNISVRDADGDLSPEDEEGNQLSFSGSGIDDLLTVQLSAVRDRRNDFVAPTRGSVLRLSTEQSVPIGNGSILMTRLRASYSQYIPVRFTNFTPGCQLENASPSDCPQALAFNVQVGTVLGDLPPYEAFSLGGTDSVRGYGPGEVGSGRSFLQATAEYRFPVFSIISGALFVDFGTDLGTADNVPGEPANVRDKPGTGLGYGLGIRIRSPIGNIRVDYGIGDDGDGQLHFGIGERF
ncbi:MAG: BamA/TamA family outer membrane protein [Leptolyngbyaceae cyanobacterium SL_7_1]|nr:BamA/TamA family outer membrane protein [Leptolyngbyaceae cyanobacterium SL_7_1]